MSDFDELEHVVADLVEQLEPGQRKQLAVRVARDLGARNAKRIAANVTPDGEPMAPRKPRLRDRKSIKQRAAGRMFRKAGSARYLRRTGTASEARIGYSGLVARIMRVHQLGLTDRVDRRPGAPTADYPARPPLGMPEEDKAAVLDLVLDHLTR